MGKIAVVILNHNKPENADKLFTQLNGVFDRVELWDSGSDSNKIPLNVTQSFGNIYWTGCWNEIMRTMSDYDAVWMIGCDITLNSIPEEYLMCLREQLPFGCWSPCVEGRAHPFMLAENYWHGNPRSVKNIEGMAMAVSGELMRHVGKLMDGSTIGFGQDYWLCNQARSLEMKNVIDGRVKIHHPPEIGYDEKKAHDEMEKIFTEKYGSQFRQEVFEYDQRYEQNLLVKGEKMEEKELVVVTVDNGWGIDEFIEYTDGLPVKRIVLQKGPSSMVHLASQGITVLPYGTNISELIEAADIALFTKVGPANIEEYKDILDAGIPTVVNVGHAKDLIKHEVDGLVYGSADWAKKWLNDLIKDKGLRDSISKARSKKVPESFIQAVKEFETGELEDFDDIFKPLVSVVTPTYGRDVKIIKRSIDCMRLQTNKDWEQLICSNGKYEAHVDELVKSIGDERIRYHHCPAKEGDFGNFARAEMIRKARGEYIMFLDDDNIVLPEFISMMTGVLEGSPADFAVCRVMHFGPLNEKEVGSPPIILTGNPVKLYHIDPLQFLVRASVMKSIGWDTDVGYVSDGVTLEKLNGRPMVEVPMVLGIHV